MKKIMLCIAIGLFFMGANAQSDSLLIDTVVINGAPYSSSHVAEITPLSTSESLATSLQSKEAVYIKNYGGMSLATLSLRGSSASQTGVYWNNLSISNNMLGLLDLSLIPSGFNEKTKLVYGSESTTFGSGNIGGGIYLENKPTNKFTFSSSMGSFNNYSTTAIVGIDRKVKSSIKVNIQRFENDYPYKLANGEERKLINGDGGQAHLMYNSFLSVAKNNFGFNYWGTVARRNIPFTTRQNSGDDSTADSNNRLNFNFKRVNKRSIIELNSGYFINTNQFFQTVLINSNVVRSFENRLTYKRIFSNYQYTLGLNQSVANANSKNYASTQKQSRIAFFGQASLRTNLVNIDMRFRQEMIDLDVVPFIPEISLSKTILKSYTFGIKGNRVYRNPTLNDLFWIPGGNSELLAEIGWAGEVFNSIELDYNKWVIFLGLTAHNRVVDNWIQWTLTEGQVFFKPLNVNKVWSRGVELRARTRYIINEKWNLNNSFSYGFNRSTYQESLSIPIVNAGDQLFYTPIHQLNNVFVLARKNTELSYTNRYFSESRGISENLGKYGISDLLISQQINIKKHYLKLSFSINNLTNTSYRIIEFRPMPGRNYLLNLTYKLN